MEKETTLYFITVLPQTPQFSHFLTYWKTQLVFHGKMAIMANVHNTESQIRH